MKKVLSLVLVIAMVLSSFSFAFAAPKFEDTADTDYAEAIDTLTALGVIKGYEDGTYRPGKTVTRAEMAKLMVELLGYGDLVTGSKSNFTDTQGHWADEWIALAAGRGIVIGTGDGKFNPDGLVTYDQVLTMLVRGLGYTDSSNEMKNMTWPTNFKVKAAELNITKNVDMSSVNADRGGVAQAMFNALDQQLVKVNADGDIVKEWRTVGTRTDIPVNLISRIATLRDTTIGFQHITPEDKNYAGDKVDLSQYLFQTVEAYYNKNKDKEIVYVGDIISLTYTDTFEDKTGNDFEVGDYVFEAANGTPVSYNNVEEKYVDLNNDNLDDAKITVVLADKETRVKDDAEVVGIIVEKANAYAQVEEEYRTDAVKIDEIFLPVKSSKVDSANLIIKGDATELADIEEDDIVAAFAPLGDDPTVKATDKLTLVVTRKTVEGTVTGKAKDAYYVNRTKYKVNEVLGLVGNEDLAVNDEGIFYLDQDGKIIAFTDESGNIGVYAVVDEVYEGRYELNAAGDKATVVRAPRVKLHTASNETITYSFDLDLKKVKDEWVVDDSNLGSVFLVSKAEGVFNEGRISFNSTANIKDLVEYKLNRSNEVTFIKEAGRKLEEVRTSSSSFVLAPNAVIFDGEGKVISESGLGTTVKGIAVYRNGRIVALLATNIVEDTTEYYAYVTEAYTDTDNDGNKIERLTAYINGAKKTLYTKDDGANFVGEGRTPKSVYVLSLNDDGVVVNKKVGSATSSSAISTASKVDTRRSEITIKGVAGAKFVAQGATIIEINGSTVNVRNLNAIKENDTTFRYYESGGEIQFIIITKTEAPVENSKVTYINAEEGLIEVDNKVLELDAKVRLVNAAGTTIEIGPKAVAGKLLKGTVLEKITTNSDGVVTEIKLK